MTTPRRSPRGFVLLVVLAAAAVLSLIAAFIYSRTENQLLLSISMRGQSMASARATLSAERTLALLRGFRTTNAAPPGLTVLLPQTDYATAVTLGQTLPFGSANYDLSGKDIASGNGAQWCVELWVLNRGLNIPPWLVVEAWGFYGTTNPKPSVVETGFNSPGCTPKGTNRIVSSHVTVHLEWPNLGSGGGGATTVDTTGAGPAGGSGAVGAF
ncbi:MAG: hypothetical protein ACXWLF_11495 [Myxococcaceae bacterium]